MTRRLFLRSLPLVLLPRLVCAQATRRWRAAVHPLNHPSICAGWWLVTPLAGHAYWGDLIHGRSAVTTGPVTSSGLQRVSSREGAFGEISYDGVDDVTTLPALLDNPTTMTLSCWLRYGTSERGIITKAVRYNGDNPGWYLRVHSTEGSVGFWLHQSTTLEHGFISSISINDDAWHHVVITLQGVSVATWTLWIDGVQDLTPTVFNTGTITSVANSEPVRLGRFGDGSDPFTGRLDDLRFYTTALQAPQIRTLTDAPRSQYHGLLADGPLLTRRLDLNPRTRGPGLLWQ